MTVTTTDRIMGCLKGIAIGDAIGKQTENLSRANVVRWYPSGIRGFEGPPGTIIPRYVGNARHEWRIGETTDDTERTIAVARTIIAEKAVSHERIGREMLACTKSVHPGVKSLWEFHQAADPTRTTTEHNGCGAAIRVAPVGMFFKSDRMDDIIDGAREASIPTHGGVLAIAAAAANAAAVSSVIDGASAGDAMAVALQAATRAETLANSGSHAAFANSVRNIRERLASLPILASSEIPVECFPTTPLTIVPLALGLATLMTSAEEAILLAANIGGDSDSVASIAGGILGALYPYTVNQSWCEIVVATNGHDLDGLAGELARLRH